MGGSKITISRAPSSSPLCRLQIHIHTSGKRRYPVDERERKNFLSSKEMHFGFFTLLGPQYNFQISVFQNYKQVSKYFTKLHLQNYHLANLQINFAKYLPYIIASLICIHYPPLATCVLHQLLNMQKTKTKNSSTMYYIVRAFFCSTK